MNLVYKNTSDIKEFDLLNCMKLWNQEMGLIYPISNSAFYQNVINYHDKDILIALDNNETIGFIILKRFNDDKLVNYTNDLFISLFYVSKKYRKNGIGTKLFDFAEEIGNGKNLIIGKDMNNFFPGVPTDFDNLTDVWLEKRGFTGTRYTHDLISYNPKSFEIRNKNIKYRYCNDDDKQLLIDFLLKNNWGRWALEAQIYFEKKGKNDNNAYIIGLENDEIVSFVRVNNYKMDLVSYNVMWKDRFEKLGGIGPLGVSKEFRKSGLGIDIISIAVNDLKNQDITPIIIDWTGLMELYSKYNFEVWKSYKYMQKVNLKN